MYAKRALFTLLALIATAAPAQTAPAFPERFNTPTGYIPVSIAPYRLPDAIPEPPAPFVRKDAAIARVIAHEGGYADNRRDPGGPTKYGITWRTARHYGYTGPMHLLTQTHAERIYGAMWEELELGTYSDHELAAQVLDAYVAHGPRALKWVGHGPNACRALNDRRMQAYRNSRNWAVFGRGWSKRVRHNVALC